MASTETLYKEQIDALNAYADTLSDVESVRRIMRCANKPEMIWDYLNFWLTYWEQALDDEGKPKFTDTGNKVKNHVYSHYFKSVRMTRETKKNPAHETTDRNYKQTTKTALARFEELTENITHDTQDDIYDEIQANEIMLLNAYAVKVLLDILDNEPKALDKIETKIADWQKKLEDEKEAKKAKDKPAK